VFSRYVKDDTRPRYSSLLKYGKQVLKTPVSIKQLTYKQAKRLLNAFAAFRDYISLLGREHAEVLNEFSRQLRKLISHRSSVKVIEYEEMIIVIIQRAFEELNRASRTNSLRD